MGTRPFKEAIDRFRQNIATLRDRGFTYKDIGEKMGVDKANFSNYLNGRHPITENIIKKFNEAWNEELWVAAGISPGYPEMDYQKSYAQVLLKNNEALLKKFDSIMDSNSKMADSNARLVEINEKVINTHIVLLNRLLARLQQENPEHPEKTPRP